MVYDVRRSINLKGIKGWIGGVNYKGVKQALETIVGSVEPRNYRFVEILVRDIDGERFFNIGMDPSTPDKVGIKIIREGLIGTLGPSDISDRQSYRFLEVKNTDWGVSPPKTANYEEIVEQVVYVRNELQRLLNS